MTETDTTLHHIVEDTGSKSQGVELLCLKILFSNALDADVTYSQEALEGEGKTCATLTRQFDHFTGSKTRSQDTFQESMTNISALLITSGSPPIERNRKIALTAS